MFQFIVPIILILASVGLFLGFTKKQYDTLLSLKSESAQYDSALQKSKELLKKRDALIEIKKSIDPIDLEKLQKLLPDDVNNTKLILEIQNIATNKYGLGFENPKYDSGKTSAASSTPASSGAPAEGGDKKPATPAAPAQNSPKDIGQALKNYGTFDLEFTITGPYDKFISFIQDLEKSLRIVDIQSIEIAGKDGSTALKYVVKIQTYWLKS